MRRGSFLLFCLVLGFALGVVGFAARPAKAEPSAGRAVVASSAIPKLERMEPAELAELVRSGHAPVVLQVGFTKLYAEGHVPGAIHAGPMVSADGRALLAKTVARMDRHKLLVIYCGCCPWEKCPNIRAAFAALRRMGFADVKALYLPDNFGVDWVRHGYPTVSGG